MQERLYTVVRFLQHKDSPAIKDYQLKKNDVIKIGRVKVKVKQIFSKDKAKQRKLKAERHLQRLEFERANMEEEKEGGKSKYPEGYHNVPMDSIVSNHGPIVGEVNYVQAVLPPIRPQLAEEKQNE